jgi:hypothetical protein
MSLFPYYGGKGALAGKYPGPYFDHIVEPFAGGANYALRHGTRREVTLYDVDERIVAVWRWLIAATSAEVLALPVLERGQLLASVTGLSDPERWFLALWAEPGSMKAWRSTKVSARGAGSGWAQARERVAGAVDRISHWRCELGPYSDAPDISATWFIDPPYQGGSSTAGAGYAHGRAAIDFARLATWTRARAGQVIACDHEDADWLPFRQLIAQQNQANAQDRAELVYLQGPQPMTDRLGRQQRQRRPGEMIMRYGGDR